MIIDLIILLLVGVGISQMYSLKAAVIVLLLGLIFVYSPLSR